MIKHDIDIDSTTLGGDMTKKDVIEKLDAIEDGDTEMAHQEADSLILQFLRANGLFDVAAAWDRVEERCGGFWYA